MSKKEQLNGLYVRQLELQTIMAHSDAHASKCSKLGLVFSETYPEEFLEYSSAREEYNANEALIKELIPQVEEEEQNEMERPEDEYEDISVGMPTTLEDGEYDAEGYKIVVENGIVIKVEEK